MHCRWDLSKGHLRQGPPSWGQEIFPLQVRIRIRIRIRHTVRARVRAGHRGCEGIHWGVRGYTRGRALHQLQGRNTGGRVVIASVEKRRIHQVTPNRTAP